MHSCVHTHKNPEESIWSCLCLCVLPQLCITTWKLFETLLCKRHRHVAYNLALRNLTSHSYIDLSLAAHDSTAQRDVSAAETNCVIDDRAETTNTDKVANFNDNTSPSSGSAHRTLLCENSDTLASGDSGLSMNSIQSPSYIPDAVVSATPNGLSGVNAVSSSYHKDESTPSPDDTCTMDSTAGGDTDLHRDTVAKNQSEFSAEAAASLLSSHTSSQASRESSEIPIQQVVYT